MTCSPYIEEAVRRCGLPVTVCALPESRDNDTIVFIVHHGYGRCLPAGNAMACFNTESATHVYLAAVNELTRS